MKYQEMNVGISDKLLVDWMKDKEYITASDEGEAVGIAGGYYLATGKPANVFMSADGFCNALNPITSWVLPEELKMNFIISVGRTESQHRWMTSMLEPIISLLNYDPERIHFEFMFKQS